MLNQFERGCTVKRGTFIYKNVTISLCLVTANVYKTRGLEPCPGIKISLMITEGPFSWDRANSPVYLCTFINIFFYI